MRTLLTILVSCVCLGLSAQNVNLDNLDRIRQYTTLDEALANPDSVYSLKLKQNLKTIPAEVFVAFPNLVELDLSKNRIKELPADIQLLKKLKRLILFKNKIEELPPQIGELTDLEELIVNQNELTTLPAEIGKLKKLRYIDMWSNNIVGLPQTMADMPALQEVDLRVIVLSEKEREEIGELLQNVKVHMDEGCNCGN